MANDVLIDNGALTDYTTATDDVGSNVHAQLVKLAYSAAASRSLVTVDANGVLVQLAAGKVDDAAFTVESDRVVMQGRLAVAHGSAPNAADAGDAAAPIMNRHRIPFGIGGHPNAITTSVRLTASSTDAAIIAGTIGSGTKVVVTRLNVNISNATTVNVGVKIGFGATTIPADSTTGAAGVLIDNDGWPPGGGTNLGDGSGILGIGADGEEIRITNDTPTTGSVHVSCTYFTIES